MNKYYYCFVENPNDITFQEFKQGAKEKGIEINPTGNIYKDKPFIALVYILNTVIPMKQYLHPKQIWYEFTASEVDINLLCDNWIDYIVFVQQMAIQKKEYWPEEWKEWLKWNEKTI